MEKLEQIKGMFSLEDIESQLYMLFEMKITETNSKKISENNETNDEDLSDY